MFYNFSAKQIKVANFQLNQFVLANSLGINVPSKWGKCVIIDKLATNTYEIILNE